VFAREGEREKGRKGEREMDPLLPQKPVVLCGLGWEFKPKRETGWFARSLHNAGQCAGVRLLFVELVLGINRLALP
jgi:hypothetical protein